MNTVIRDTLESLVKMVGDKYPDQNPVALRHMLVMSIDAWVKDCVDPEQSFDDYLWALQMDEQAIQQEHNRLIETW